jgi:putative membrane protein
MNEPKVAAENKHRSLAKGLLAGLIAGLAATAAKALVERIVPPHPKHDPASQEPNSNPTMSKTQQALAKARESDAVRWGLGAAVGATYGALAEFYPEATSRYGASFGLALEAMSHEGALPALGLAATAEARSAREQGSEIASYLVYGVTTELVRRFVRRWL